MKKLLLILPAFLLTGCVSEPLPPITTTSTSGDPSSYQAVLNPASSGLTTDDTVEPLSPNLAIEGREETYNVEIGPNCYYSTKHNEMILKKGGYFKSTSTYSVSKLIIDSFNGQGLNYNVYAGSAAGETALESYASTIEPLVPAEGSVLEYLVNGDSWYIDNTTDYKMGIYSITVVFTLN